MFRLAKVLVGKEKGIRIAPLDRRGYASMPRQSTVNNITALEVYTRKNFGPSPEVASTLMVPPHFNRQSFIREVTGNSKIRNVRNIKRIINNMNVRLKFDRKNRLPKCDTCIRISNAEDFAIMMDGNHFDRKLAMKAHLDNIRQNEKFYFFQFNFSGLTAFKTASIVLAA